MTHLKEGKYPPETAPTVSKNSIKCAAETKLSRGDNNRVLGWGRKSRQTVVSFRKIGFESS